MKPRSQFIALSALTVAFALSAVEVRAAEVVTQERPVSPRVAERLQEQVRRELVMLPFYGVFDNLAYSIDVYTVNLYGQVTRPTLKSDAEAAIRRIEGVEKINNQIEVLPVSPSDDALRLATYRAVYGQGSLERYAMQAIPPIHIIVKNGHVTLVGVVATQADRTLAELHAKGVSGVFSVTNNLRAEK